MMEYISDPGYFGGEAAVKAMGLITPKDVSILFSCMICLLSDANLVDSLVLVSLLRSGSILRGRLWEIE
jgi:hypothetical protein